MKWIERINATVLTVVTGDGKVYKPLFRNRGNNVYEIDGNAVPLEFNDIDGALVVRGALGVTDIDFEFIFQGDDHMDIRDEFMESIKDRRPWVLSHPSIGSKLVQFATLSLDFSIDNITTISGRLYETIESSYPSSGVSEKRESEIKLESSITEGISVSNDLKLSPADINTVTETTERMSLTAKLKSVTDIDLEKINNAIAEGSVTLSSIGSEPSSFMRDLSNIIRTPTRYLDTINNRVSVLKASYEDLKNAISGTPSLAEKMFFEIAGSFNIIAIGEANLIPISEIADDQGVELETKEIITRRQVLSSINDLKDIYNSYLSTLGELQSDIDNRTDSYSPSHENIYAFQSAIFSVVGSLLNMSVSAKREISYLVPQDTPLVLLVHTLMGTVDSDIMKQFVDDNNLGRDEVLIVPQYKEVFYYI